MTPDPITKLLRGVAVVAAVGFAVFAYVYLTLPDVRALARTNPPTTAFMELRAREARDAGRQVRKVQRWVPYSRISRNLTRAVIVAEDGDFWQHEGLDYDEIRKSIEIAIERGGTIRGASTITQQLAKNLYLSPSRNPLRKLREVFITRRLEATLPKARIFEIYLNVVEWGTGIWGAEAAARTYFGVSASDLTREQAALLAGALINPVVYSPARPPARLLRRQQIILARMGGVEPPAPVAAPVPPPAPVTDEPADAFPSSDQSPTDQDAPDETDAPDESELPEPPVPLPFPPAEQPSPEPLPPPVDPAAR